jgi:hypothetical protein
MVLAALLVKNAATTTASRPACVTIASAPRWDGMAENIKVIWVKREAIYFCQGGLDG